MAQAVRRHALAADFVLAQTWTGAAPVFAAHRFNGDTAAEVEEAFGPNHTLRELVGAVGAALDV